MILSPEGIAISDSISILELENGHVRTGGAIIRGEIDQIGPGNIEQLDQAIATGNERDIWAFILGSINSPESAIRGAFESGGQHIIPAPAWFPQKSIWYAAQYIP